ncbi:MAG: hypothetical protein M1833_006095 [Piccolia ochrophora]|nr:MAG: hypothetical protein M1833_006095 [Piccolia ochrophora]
MSSHASLDAQANERKARLAKLKSLKNKQAPSEESSDLSAVKSPTPDGDQVTKQYLSGRNYDVATRGPKLGFEVAPNEGQVTLENQAASIVTETAQVQAEEEKADKPIDLFKLQPKKPNWDLKRDLERKMELLNVRTENAIARLVRQRIQEQQDRAKTANEPGKAAGDGETIGMEGSTLVEGVHLREREEQEDERREQEDEDLR